TPQRKKLILRRRYWLYYALTFMGGARRQIFTVFASLMMVQIFGYEVHQIALLFLINCLFNIAFAARIGGFIGRFGERRALSVEYIGLIVVFGAYAFVQSAWAAAALYVIDHAFFAFSIAMKTYFQKIADPPDIAQTAGVASTINHLAAVGIPAAFGMIWLVSPAAVFLIGAGMASVSLVLARLVPRHPEAGNELIWQERARLKAAAAQ
ncbi:MAG: MFS transporter, partial [Alphaproteobacteria bacterium]